MKHLSYMTKKTPILLGAAFALAGCMTDAEQLGSTSDEIVSVDGESCATLYAGQNTAAGSVCSSVEGDDLVVTYTTTDGWEMTYAHLWVGVELADMPQARNGNPKIGNFPHHSGDIVATSYEFRLPLSQWGLSGSATACDPLTLLMAAHADLRKANGDGYQTETGWAEGSQLGRSWAMYTSITLICSTDEGPGPVEGGCTTAYAYGGDDATCFIGADFDDNGADDGFKRWGWSNGPLAPNATHTFDVYAAAGQCNLGNGSLVGTVTVTYDGSSAQITYDADPDYGFTQFHSYAGSEPLPRGNDGQYCIANGTSCMDLVEEFDTEQASFTWTATGLSGDIYVVAHAVACGPGLD